MNDALAALESLGAPSEALEAVKSLDVDADGLAPLEWTLVALRACRGEPLGTWGWAAMARAA